MRSAAGAVLLVVAAAACGGPSDTGFTGRWSRSDGDTTVAIWREGDAWRFCWSTPARGEGPVTRCGAGGTTEMHENGQKTSEYAADARADADPRVLIVRVEGRPVDPDLTPIRWVDRLELQPGGLHILSYKTELNGVPRNPPTGPMRLTKVADDPS
jgi:hypothetical protein